MAQRHPSREIAFIIALSVALAAGLYAYISSTIERPQAPALVAPSAMRAAPRDTRPDDARRVATAFVQRLAATRYDDAYLMMANAYRQTTPLSAFRAARAPDGRRDQGADALALRCLGPNCVALFV